MYPIRKADECYHCGLLAACYHYEAIVPQKMVKKWATLHRFVAWLCLCLGWLWGEKGKSDHAAEGALLWYPPVSVPTIRHQTVSKHACGLNSNHALAFLMKAALYGTVPTSQIIAMSRARHDNTLGRCVSQLESNRDLQLHAATRP